MGETWATVAVAVAVALALEEEVSLHVGGDQYIVHITSELNSKRAVHKSVRKVKFTACYEHILASIFKL